MEEQEENLVIHTLEETDNIRGAGLMINEWGYTYSASKDNGSIIEKEIRNNVLNKELGNKGEEREISEIILWCMNRGTNVLNLAGTIHQNYMIFVRLK